MSIDDRIHKMRDVRASNKMRTRRGPNINCSTGSQINHSPGSHFRMLDLFCGEGLSAWGYWLSGFFSEIVGIDNNPIMSNRYSFDFICGNALACDYEFLDQFDFIHASPPCQGYSKNTPKDKRKNHMRLIQETHLMLHASGKPYVIENVEGSSKDLRPNIVLNGQSLGLQIDRRRYFHASTLQKPIRKIRSSRASNLSIHNDMKRDDIIKYMGLEVINPNALAKMTRDGMLQGIPPIMTRFISSGLFTNKIIFT